VTEAGATAGVVVGVVVVVVGVVVVVVVLSLIQSVAGEYVPSPVLVVDEADVLGSGL